MPSLNIQPLNSEALQQLRLYWSRVPCGAPLQNYAEGTETYDPLGWCRNPGDAFVVEACGDSMAPEIKEGDKLIIDGSRTPRNGDTVLAQIDNEAFIKYFYHDKQNNRVILEPHNTRYKPIQVDCNKQKFEVKGVVMMVMHQIKQRLVQPQRIAEQPAPLKVVNIQTGTEATAPPADSPLKSAADIAAGLDPFFGPAFKGRNKAQVNYLDMLATDIHLYSNAKNFARIANMMYSSREMLHKPRNFSEWYRLFCCLTGAPHNPNYRQCMVEDYLPMQERFYYLTN